MKTLAITLLISNSAIVWSVIGLFLVAAFALKVVDSIKTVKQIEKTQSARKAMGMIKNETTIQNDAPHAA